MKVKKNKFNKFDYISGSKVLSQFFLKLLDRNLKNDILLQIFFKIFHHHWCSA